jgi:hypothetical protein
MHTHPTLTVLAFCVCVCAHAATNFVFVHHSVGENWLLEGDLHAALSSAGFAVHDTNYGDDVPGTSPFTPIGDFTDVCHWYWWFNHHYDSLRAWECPSGEYNRIVMFKSCYPNSALYEEGAPPGDPTNDNQTTWNYKAAYLSLTGVFEYYCATLFIPVTAPPMRKGDGYDPDAARRYRAFTTWLTGDYVRDYEAATHMRNVVPFDLFDILATAPTVPRGANALHRTYQTRDSHPNAKGSRMATGAFLPFLRNVMHYRETGVYATNAPLKLVKAKLKTPKRLLKLKANVDDLNGTPGTTTVMIGSNVVQTFGVTLWQSKGATHKAKAANKAQIKLQNKREPRITLKLLLPAAAGPLKIDLGNGAVFVVDLLFDAQGRFP